MANGNEGIVYKEADHIFAICAYGKSPFLEECIRSVASQSNRSSSVICTSTPNEHIFNLAENWGLKVYVRAGDSNIADDWNYAIDCALSDEGRSLVTIAHQDDVYLRDYTESMLQKVNSVKKPLLYFTNYGEIRNGAVANQSNLLAVKRRMLAPLKLRAFRKSKLVRRRILAFGSAICCPSVTLCCDNVGLPVFEKGMKSNLDWQAWERISKIDGAFLYDPRVLMLHRIHEASETSRLIKDDTRAAEDLYMYQQFWPAPIASILNKLYALGRAGNDSPH